MKKDIFILPEALIKEALKKLDQTGLKTLLVVDESQHILGTVTDGDIRRYIIKTGTIEGNIDLIYNKNPIKVSDDYKINEVKKIFTEKRVEVIPVVNRQQIIIDYLVWNEIFDRKRIKSANKIDIPVVIMAGGKGTRLLPFTHVLPKPLMPIGEKTVIEHIIDRFKNQGISSFTVIINYKGDMIKAYFNGIKKDYDIEFVKEAEFLGTAGGLSLLTNLTKENIIVTNCDILLNVDINDLLKFHNENSSDFTIVSSIQHYKIPYGVIETEKEGKLNQIKEKPEFVFQVNTGVYILKKHCLNHIPQNTVFDMPDLINAIKEKGGMVSVYPIKESDYIDIGQWEEYRKAVLKLSF